ADLTQGSDERAGGRGGDGVAAGADEVDGRSGGAGGADQGPRAREVGAGPASVLGRGGPWAVGLVSGEVGWQHLAGGGRQAGAAEPAGARRPVDGQVHGLAGQR